MAPLAIGFGLGSASSLIARQAIKLSVQAARGEFLIAVYFFATFPPLSILRFMGDGLRSCFCLRRFRAFTFFFRL